MSGVTPAEAAVLYALHHGNVGSIPVKDVVPTDDVKRTDRQEIQRLCGIYQRPKVLALFPGLNPRLPKTFEEVLDEPPGDLPESEYMVESGGKMPTKGINTTAPAFEKGSTGDE